MGKDRTTIANDENEIKTAAKSMGVAPVFIHIAKHVTHSNKREVIEAWIEDKKRLGTVSLTFQLTDSHEEENIGMGDSAKGE
jgi:hypothetical protein